MSTAELQNSIIQKVLKISDSQLLDYLNSLLQEDESSSYYSMNDWELKVIQESISEYERGEVISNEDVFNKNEKWLNE
jgi:predicted transcriptional regulator